MAQPAQVLQGDDLLLARYMRSRARRGSAEPAAPAPGHQIRICPGCGERSIFSLDPEGTWFRCHRCGHYA